VTFTVLAGSPVVVITTFPNGLGEQPPVHVFAVREKLTVSALTAGAKVPQEIMTRTTKIHLGNGPSLSNWTSY
jgi:hypothetical protein